MHMLFATPQGIAVSGLNSLRILRAPRGPDLLQAQT